MSSTSQKVTNAAFNPSFIADDALSEKSRNSTKSSHFLVKAEMGKPRFFGMFVGFLGF